MEVDDGEPVEAARIVTGSSTARTTTSGEKCRIVVGIVVGIKNKWRKAFVNRMLMTSKRWGGRKLDRQDAKAFSGK